MNLKLPESASIPDAYLEASCPTCPGAPYLERREDGWSCPDCWSTWDTDGTNGRRRQW